jgi:hypothetical protein
MKKNASSIIFGQSRSGRLPLGLLLFLTLAAPVRLWAAPSIPNPSFEANAPFADAPGTLSQAGNGPIIGWTTNDPTRVGLNPAGGLNFFADNGKVPQGTRVAFLRSEGATTTLSTTITGLTVGTHYRVQFRTNVKAGGLALGSYSINGAVPVVFSVNAVDLPGVRVDPYNTINILFTASAATAALEISNTTTTDTTMLVDNFVITAAAPIQVTNVNNDGPGSLRQAIKTAESTPAFNVITFAPALSGRTITLLQFVRTSDTSGLVIDALNLPKGITITGETSPLPGMVWQGNVILQGLNFVGYDDVVFDIECPVAQIARCTFSGNGDAGEPLNDGAFSLSGGSHLTLTQCTLSGNTSTNGGAIRTFPSSILVMNHCTVSGNTATMGGGIRNGGKLFLSNSIIAGNTATNGSDIANDGNSAVVTLIGANIIQDLDDTNGGTTSGDPLIDSPPGLLALADNGGPTLTMAVQPGSPARNASVESNVSSDQRGKPIQGSAADIGAFDVQRGTFTLSPGGGVIETGGTKTVTINRTGGFEGAVSVNLSTAPGTATAADFTALNNLVVNFPDGDVLETRNITIAIDGVVEANEVFTAKLSAPSAGATLGTPVSTTVTIVDPSALSVALDTVEPAAPIFTSPAANARVNAVNNTITVTGTASDNKGVALVRVRFIVDGAAPTAFQPAALTSPQATTTVWTVPIDVSAMNNTLTVEVQALDSVGQDSAIVSRSFKLQFPLVVRLDGNGTVSPGFAPSSFREVGEVYTITATPAAGQIFIHWTVTGTTFEAAGVQTDALSRQTLTFRHQKPLVLTAVFRTSPYNINRVGSYRGVIQPVADTDRSISTVGLFTAAVTSTGAFSGKVEIDSLVINFAGAFDADGFARFGTSRATVLNLPRAGKPSLKLRCEFDVAGSEDIEVTVDEVDFRGKILATSDGAAIRARVNGSTTTVPANLLGTGGANGIYNVIMEAQPTASQPAGFQATFYPQGTGFGTLTLSKTGLITLTNCTLADGTVVTASAFLSNIGSCDIFIPLYSRKGFLAARLSFNLGQADSDIAPAIGFPPLWSRPFLNSHYYPEGWPEVIEVGMLGARYTVTPAESGLKAPGGVALQAPDANGNATIEFERGQISVSNFKKTLNLSTADVATKVPASDPTFTIKVTRSNGLISGTFRHTDATTVPFKGIIYQKGAPAGGHGFFLTQQPVPITYTGEGGKVELIGAP